MALVALACGLEEGGVVDGVEGGPSPTDAPTSTADTYQPGPPDVLGVDTYLPPSCGDAAACLPNVPAGWQIAIMLPEAGAQCPANFNTTDLQTGAAFDPGACACACAETSDAGCSAGPFQLYGPNGGNNCKNNKATTLTAGCNAYANSNGGVNDPNFAINAPAATGISCGGPTKTGSQSGSAQTARLCQPTCAADFCGAATGGPRACIVTPNDVPCPGGFTKMLAGSAVDYVCGTCSCSAKSGQTCALSVDLYATNDCSDASLNNVTSNGACQKWAGSNKQWGSTGLTVTPPNGPFCTSATVDPGGDASLVGPKTICCK